MLCLTRSVDQTIQIGPDITVTVTQIKGGQVKIGIEAPRSISIRRGELPPITEWEQRQRAMALEARAALR